ncbi:MAG: hypothetical protein ABJA66_13925 [Actinomycetota bacterium]
MPTIIRAEFLSYYNRVQNSDKLFNVFLIRDDNGTYSCLTENGRRGNKLVCRTICEKARRETAESSFWEKVREKRNHRETSYREESFGNSYSELASQYTFNTQTSTTNKTNVSKTDESKPKVINFPVDKTEKQVPKTKQNGILNSDQFDSLEF